MKTKSDENQIPLKHPKGQDDIQYATKMPRLQIELKLCENYC